MRWIVVVIGVALFAGCDRGPEMGQVSGTVTYRGKPIQFGNVMLQPTAGGATSIGTIGSDGTFKMATEKYGEGTATGLNLVKVTSFEAQDPSRNMEIAIVGLGKSLIPVRYTSYGTSGLSLDVKPGENPPFNIELVD